MKDISWLLNTPIAHRGCHSSDIPENSIEAFSEAIKQGLNIELDVHKTKDDILVVFHDSNLFRLTSLDKIVEDCTYSEIQKLVLNKSNERIPTLKNVLDYVNGQVGLLIEIKQHPDIGKLEELISQSLDTYKGNFAVQSFDPLILKWFYKNRSWYIRGQLSSGLKGEKISFLKKFLLQNLIVNLISKPDFISYNYVYLNLWIKLISIISRVPIIVWTVNDAVTARRVRRMAKNIIFEDFNIEAVMQRE
jgi:glycerophosphoryl diester phosphodiesterase